MLAARPRRAPRSGATCSSRRATNRRSGIPTTPATDAVAALNAKLQDGSASLAFDPANGYLRSVLDALEVPVESQTLVFSQTSFQAPLINIHNPRAVYFNDTVAVGWVRGGRILEIAAQDPRQGVIFYALEQKPSRARPRFVRNNDCLACHLSWETLGVPGLTVQSVYPLPDDISYVNGFTTIHGSPLEQRWGGWWVTGDHGGAQHMGNIPVMPADKGKSKLANPTRALASVEGLFDLKGYPTPHSDVVALLVLAHQTHMTNLITRTGWEARLAAAKPSADALGARDRSGARPGRLPAVRRRGAACRTGEGRFGIRRAVRGGRAARHAGALAARLRPASSAVPVSVQLHDLHAGVRRAAGAGE